MWEAVKFLWMLTGALVWLFILVLGGFIAMWAVKTHETDKQYDDFKNEQQRRLDEKIRREREEETREQEA